MHHTALGINAASTLSLELTVMDKPTVTLDFKPIESTLSGWSRFSRHANSEHYRPVVAGGGVMLARALEKLN